MAARTSQGLTEDPCASSSTWPAPGLGTGTVRVLMHEVKGVKHKGCER